MSLPDRPTLRSDYRPGDIGVYLPGEAEGAYPNGTRIVKVRSEEGDGTTIGTGGVVLSSMAIPDDLDVPLTPDGARPSYFYFVKFDDFPQPLGITDWKIVESDP